MSDGKVDVLTFEADEDDPRDALVLELMTRFVVAAESIAKSLEGQTGIAQEPIKVGERVFVRNGNAARKAYP